MAALVEGRQYALSSLQSASAGKTLVHVKLTDSAYRAIEEFIRIKDVTERRPLIKFGPDNGVFKIPIKKSSDNPEGLRNFQFSVASLQGDPNGSFDCLKQRGSMGLEALGSMLNKIVVRASDDVYQTTRERMTIAEEESKKFCAKEIKPSGPNIGRKVKKVVNRSALEDRLKPMSANNSPSASYSSSPSAVTGGATAAVKQRSQVHAHHSSSQNVSAGKSGSLSPHSHSTAPGAASKDSATHRQNPRVHKPPPNPTVFNLPIKERIIHLLVLRPYKKPELMIRLQRDGLRDKDKGGLSAILKEVGVLQKDNSYTLNKSYFPQIRSNWPGYQEVDRSLLKRVQAKKEMTPSTAATSPALSPAHSNSSSQGSSPGSSHKRPTSTTDEDVVPSKRQRVAHDRREHNSSSQAKKDSPASSTSESPKVTTTTPDVNPEVKPTVTKEKPEKHRSHHADKQSSHKENIHINMMDQQTTRLPASSTSEIPEYVLKYPSISDCDQRAVYKAAFNAEYEEYRTLHSDVAKVLRRFKELEAEIRRQKEGTQDYENTKNEILTQYKKVKQNSDFTEQRQRCDYLHKKLAHIKHCITDYDRAQHAMS